MSHISIVLAGNPNCGKTTLFNKLTGAHQHVANWPGVTVERKTGRLLGQRDVLIQDLPGIYSLSPYSLEEVVSRDYLLNERPDAIINIVDASNLERNLYLTTQLREIGIPVVLGLNMIDLVRKNGDRINITKLSAALGCEVVETSAIKGIGCKHLGDSAVRLAVGKNTQQVLMPCFSAPVEQALAQIETLLQEKCDPKQIRWYSIRVFEKDEKAFESLKLNSEQKKKILDIVSAVEDELDDDSESIIANDRYNYITNLVRECVEKKKQSATSLSDRIDSVVTNRWLALPIFALLMWGVYYLSIQTIGTIGTDWVNDVLFGEWIPGAVGSFLESIHCAEWLQALILDGIIAGVGAVLGFLPQMMVLFVCLALLEDCGYMARVAFVMDRLFRKFGLSGKSFIPLMV
ncbi:MAG TPA: ferrous iron transport protein B, partial [Verrucomicrobiota bacterium]|nr:ferrous iron transport protein B [Verrucomicrobiota bacterium]